jgi:hypothetical protein
MKGIGQPAVRDGEPGVAVVWREARLSDHFSDGFRLHIGHRKSTVICRREWFTVCRRRCFRAVSC